MIKSPILKVIAQETRKNVPAKLKDAVERAITAGLTVMHSPQSHQLMVREISKPGDPAANAGEGVAKLVGILYKDSQGKLPLQALIPAGTILLCEALEFLAEAGKIEITNETVGTATESYTSAILQIVGATPDKLQQMAQQRQAGQVPQEEEQLPPEPAGLVSGARQGA